MKAIDQIVCEKLTCDKSVMTELLAPRILTLVAVRKVFLTNSWEHLNTLIFI
jgi:hypothetical protein